MYKAVANKIISDFEKELEILKHYIEKEDKTNSLSKINELIAKVRFAKEAIKRFLNC